MKAPLPLATKVFELHNIDLYQILGSAPEACFTDRTLANRYLNFCARAIGQTAEESALRPNSNIDSTLLILHSRLKPHGPISEIEVVKDYGDLPKVECYPGQLNQVFMNIIGNAIDALESQPPPKIIEISTDVVAKDSLEDREGKSIGQFVLIRIRDNGAGLTEKAASRLFDPFFTTKPAGKGTGLGLSICYQIVVEKHGGSLKCISQAGQGAEFWIQIPIAPPAVPKT